MIIEPNSNIRLMKSSIELDSINQLTFNSKSAQESYFKSLQHVQIDDSSYQRKDGYIRFPLPFDEAIKYNYCMYQNESYSNKWFYAFVTNVEYLNDETSAVYIETDVFQTWQFDILWRESFIEREMLATADDIAGANTQPENVELGNYIYNKQCDYYYDSKILYGVAFAVSDKPDGVIEGSSGSGSPISLDTINEYNGILNGVAYVSPDDPNKFVEMYDKSDKIDAIQSMFIYPYDAYDHQTHYWWKSGVTPSGEPVTVDYVIPSSSASKLSSFDFDKPTYVAKNYNPKNKKLFTYPYCFFNFTNNVGLTESFRYEDFTLVSNKIRFNIYASIGPGMSIKAIPFKYKINIDSQDDFLNEMYNDGITAGKLPICSWNSDVYTNWLTQNALNVPLSIIGSGLQIGSGALLGAGGATQIASGILGIANSISQIYQASLTPNQARGNINNSDINYSYGAGMFTVYHMTIKEEYARVIDNFWSMFGYKTNLVKLPNLNNRSNWNYVKTINANIIGDIPQKDMQKIKDLFNNGITLWHNPATFLDYSQTNS